MADNSIYSATPPLAFKELRKRILRIAASYIGQTTYVKNGKRRYGFDDLAFETKMKNVGWQSTQHYCNYFCRLVYKEALTTGNQYVNSTLNYPDNWEGRFKHLKDIRKWKRGTFGLLDPQVENTRKNYQLVHRYINITNYPMSKWGTQTATSKRAGFAPNIVEASNPNQPYILPGDIITFDWNNKERYNQHIGIYLAPANANCTKIITIEGNCGSGQTSSRNGCYKRIRSAGDINGFGQLTVLPRNIQKQ
jgi:signal peptidase I